MPQRAYHFLPSHYALDDLRNRRLKIARLDDLNDPFDLWSVSQPDARVRRELRERKPTLARMFGMVSFSLSWQNPLLWSHYADRHRGIALGFDINPDKLKTVRYVAERPILKEVNELFVDHLLYTKYLDWKYEQEVRVFTSLEETDAATGLYFSPFSDDCVLKEVIVGPLSGVTKSDLREVLGAGFDQVELTKGRLAFNSFNIVRNKRGFKST